MSPSSKAALLLVLLSALTHSADAGIFTNTNAGIPTNTFSAFLDTLKNASRIDAILPKSLEQAFLKMENARECSHVLPAIANILLKEMKLYYFYGPNVADRVVVSLSNAQRLLNHARWKAERPIASYTFGWLHTPTISYTQEVIKAYHHNGSYNLLVSDWSGVSHLEYSMAVSLVVRVGQALGAALQSLVAGGARLGVVVGHSLGAHVAGSIARTLRPPPPLLVGLDPAGPLFDSTKFKCQTAIKSSDAELVVAVHTDWDRLGSNMPTGPIDFMPNDGHRLQPGCNPLDLDSFGPLCSHTRAIFLWCEVVRNPGLVLGRQCTSWNSFEKGNCANNYVLEVGARTNQTGLFYLRTDNRVPYSRGTRGI